MNLVRQSGSVRCRRTRSSFFQYRWCPNCGELINGKKDTKIEICPGCRKEVCLSCLEVNPGCHMSRCKQKGIIDKKPSSSTGRRDGPPPRTSAGPRSYGYTPRRSSPPRRSSGRRRTVFGEEPSEREEEKEERRTSASPTSKRSNLSTEERLRKLNQTLERTEKEILTTFERKSRKMLQEMESRFDKKLQRKREEYEIRLRDVEDLQVRTLRSLDQSKREVNQEISKFEEVKEEIREDLQRFVKARNDMKREREHSEIELIKLEKENGILRDTISEIQEMRAESKELARKLREDELHNGPPPSFGGFRLPTSGPPGPSHYGKDGPPSGHTLSMYPTVGEPSAPSPMVPLAIPFVPVSEMKLGGDERSVSSRTSFDFHSHVVTHEKPGSVYTPKSGKVLKLSTSKEPIHPFIVSKKSLSKDKVDDDEPIIVMESDRSSGGGSGGKKKIGTETFSSDPDALLRNEKDVKRLKEIQDQLQKMISSELISVE